MSFKALAWAFDQELRNPEKAILIALAYRDNHDEPHGCFPSLARIAKDCGVNPSTVVRCVESLEASGRIKRRRRTDEKGDPASTYYNFPGVWGVVAEGNSPSAEGNKGRRGRQQGVVAEGNTNLKDLTVSKPIAPSKLALRQRRADLERQDLIRRYQRKGVR